MTRPQFVRADTLDLQDHDHPHAQDHTRSPSTPAPLGVGPPAAHQDSSLRHVEAERYAEREHLADTWGSNHTSAHTSSRTSHEGSDLLDEDNNMFADLDNDRQMDDQNLQQDPPEDDGEEVDESGDEIVDDDMIDKISSSPSITDGRYRYLRSLWPIRQSADLSDEPQILRTSPTPPAVYTFGPSVDGPDPPLSISEDHHPNGKYGDEERAWWNVGDPPHLTCEPAYRRSSVSGDRALLHEQQTLWPIEEEDDDLGLGDGSVRVDVDDNNNDDDDDDDDDSDDFSFLDVQHVDYGWGGECLHKVLEEIDFEFVYALHTFVATVEGQANATKGETMVLLDDTNSYWWLVRVVKDNSIGYLPAEHIETPTERLARLNKHRNQELASSMLQDTQEKSKNPLKKAMRRRNAKMVQFSQPTYFDAVEIEWSDLENEQNGSDDMDDDEINSGSESQAANGSTDSLNEGPASNGQVSHGDSEELASKAANGQNGHSSSKNDEDQTVDSYADEELAPSRTKNGTIRNTDSFFKDDKAEPKKISLTPNLLREDSASSSARSSESKDKVAEIFDQLDKENGVSTAKAGKDKEKEKDDRKRKEKKPGMLSGLFKKKDKKLKVDEASGGIVKAKDGAPDSPSYATAEFATEVAPTSPTGQTVKRQTSSGKLTKAPPQSQQNAKATNADSTERPGTANAADDKKDPPAVLETINKPSKESKPTLAVNVPETDDERLEPGKKDSGKTSPLATLLGADTPKKEKLKKAKQRMQLDVDSSPDSEMPSPNPSTVNLNASQPVDALEFSQRQPDDEPLTSPRMERDTSHSSILGADFPTPRLNTSVLDTPTPSEGAAESIRSAGTTTTANEYFSAAESASPERSSTPTLSTTANTQTSSASTTTTSTPTAPTHSFNASSHASKTDTGEKFDAAALSRYVQQYGHSSVKNLMIIIHDTTGVQPVSPDHPLMVKLGFREKQQRLKEMERELDGLVGEFLALRGHPAGFRGRVVPPSQQNQAQSPSQPVNQTQMNGVQSAR